MTRRRAARLLALALCAAALCAAALLLRRRTQNAPPPAPPALATIPPEHQGKLALFLLAGQSNMSGRAPMPAPLPEPLASVHVFGNDEKWHEGREPVDFAEGQLDLVSADPGAGAGPSIAFAAALRHRRPDLVIGLVPCAKGGSSLAEWRRDLSRDTLYGSCVARAKAARAMGHIAGLLFFQGEADAVAPALAAPRRPDPSGWARAFEAFVESIRRDLDAPDLPIVFAEIGRSPGNEAHFPAWDEVKAQQRLIALPRVTRIRTDDLGPAGGLHHDYEGYRAIGERFAEAMSPWMPPP